MRWSVRAIRHSAGNLEAQPQVVAGIVQALRRAACGDLGGKGFEVFAVGLQLAGRQVARDDLAQAAAVVGLVFTLHIYVPTRASFSRLRALTAAGFTGCAPHGLSMATNS